MIVTGIKTILPCILECNIVLHSSLQIVTFVHAVGNLRLYSVDLSYEFTSPHLSPLLSLSVLCALKLPLISACGCFPSPCPRLYRALTQSFRGRELLPSRLRLRRNQIATAPLSANLSSSTIRQMMKRSSLF